MTDTPIYAADTVDYAEPVTIKTGYYPATCLGIEDVTHDEHGPRWKWHWSLGNAHPAGGDFALTVWTPPRVSDSGIANIMAAALGQPYNRGQKFDRGAVRGRQSTLYVVLDEAKGRDYVRDATPLQQAAQANGAPATPQPVQSVAADPEYAEFLALKQAKAQAAAEQANAETAPDALPPPPAEAPADMAESGA